MFASIRHQVTNSKLLPWLALIAAVVSFNNWVISLAFHSSILLRGADISELSALNQPHQFWFRSLDIIAGCLFIFFMLLLSFRPVERTRGYWFLLTGTVVMGIANIFDAIDPLHCSWTANSSCIIEANLSRHGINFPIHAYSSIIIAICFMVLPLTGFFVGKSLGSLKLKAFSLLVTAAELEANASIVYQFIFRQSYIEPSWGVNQELQILLLSAWFVLLGATVLSPAKASLPPKLDK